MSLSRMIFGDSGVTSSKQSSKANNRELVRKWERELKSQMRQLDRDMLNIKREEEKFKVEMKKLAKQGASKSALANMAKTVVKSRNSREKLLLTKTQINSISLTLSTMASQLRVADTLSSSTQLMKQMNQAMNLPKMNIICRDMAMEMHKAGLIEEAIDDSFAMMEDDELELEADEQVEMVMDEILDGIMVNGQPLKRRNVEEQQEVEKEDQEEDQMIARLQGL